MILTGEVEAMTSENLVVPRTPSWLLAIRWLADDGAIVKKGDRVIEFDSSSFSLTLEDKRQQVVRTYNELASEVARATAAVADKQMEVGRKRSELAKADAEASVPADLFPRRLHQEKQMTLAQKKDALAKAEDELATEQRAARLERTVKEVALSRAERELRDLNARLEELTLRAPRDGLVQLAVNRREGRKFLVGDQSFPGMVVVSMPDLGAMQVRARLSDVDDGAIKEGMPAYSVLDAYPTKVWKGIVKHVSPVARLEGREASRRFFDVTIALDEAAPDIMRPGMSMRIEVIRRKADKALIVPRVAVHRVSGKTELRLTGGKAMPIEIDWCTEMACVLRAERATVTEGTPLVARGQDSQGTS